MKRMMTTTTTMKMIKAANKVMTTHVRHSMQVGESVSVSKLL